MKPVNSSNIKSVGYDPTAKRLSIEFHNSGTYHFEDFPPEMHEALMAAASYPTQSVGKHFNANIKGKFKHTKLEE